MSICKQQAHRIRIRYEPLRWRWWKYRVVIFCICCDLEVTDPFDAS